MKVRCWTLQKRGSVETNWHPSAKRFAAPFCKGGNNGVEIASRCCKKNAISMLSPLSLLSCFLERRDSGARNWQPGASNVHYFCILRLMDRWQRKKHLVSERSAKKETVTEKLASWCKECLLLRLQMTSIWEENWHPSRGKASCCILRRRDREERIWHPRGQNLASALCKNRDRKQRNWHPCAKIFWRLDMHELNNSGLS